MRVSQPSGVRRVHPVRCSEGLLYVINDACKAEFSYIVSVLLHVDCWVTWVETDRPQKA